MKITFLPHALEQMAARGISEEEIRNVLEGNVDGRVEHRESVRGRRIAEYLPPGERLALKVVYNLGSIAEDEHIVITVMRGRPPRSAGGPGR